MQHGVCWGACTKRSAKEPWLVLTLLTWAVEESWGLSNDVGRGGREWMLVEPLSNFADHNDVDTTDAEQVLVHGDPAAFLQA